MPQEPRKPAHSMEKSGLVRMPDLSEGHRRRLSRGEAAANPAFSEAAQSGLFQTALRLVKLAKKTRRPPVVWCVGVGSAGLEPRVLQKLLQDAGVQAHLHLIDVHREALAGTRRPLFLRPGLPPVVGAVEHEGSFLDATLPEKPDAVLFNHLAPYLTEAEQEYAAEKIRQELNPGGWVLSTRHHRQVVHVPETQSRGFPGLAGKSVLFDSAPFQDALHRDGRVVPLGIFSTNDPAVAYVLSRKKERPLPWYLRPIRALGRLLDLKS